MGVQPTGVLTPDDLNDTDKRVLNVLQQGRVTPQYVAEELDVSRTYASERLKRMVEHGHVRRLASGLYELADDPRPQDEYNELGDGLDWEKLHPVGPWRADRLEFVTTALREADHLGSGLTWSDTFAVRDGEGTVTVEEVLGALGEAEALLEHAREADDAE